MPALTQSATLANGLKIPSLGLGTWRIPDGQPVIDMAKTDPTAPARNAWDILPPEISQKIGG